MIANKSKISPSPSFVLTMLAWALLTSTLLSADPLTDELADHLALQIAELKAAEDASRPSQPVQLISQSELDALPRDTAVSWSSNPVSPDGPVIEIASPTHNGTYEGPFPIKVDFQPGPRGYAVDISSLKLEYKRAWGIDITDRIREFITGTTIDVQETEFPTGRHTIEIEINDVANNLSRRIFTVIVR